MMENTQIEAFYKEIIMNIESLLPEGITEVDLPLMNRLGLLQNPAIDEERLNLTRYFHVIESPDKITLINKQFVIWIVPERINDEPTTYTLIALNRPDGPQLETAFSTWGIYNSSRLVLRVLEKFLLEIQETEKVLSELKKS